MNAPSKNLYTALHIAAKEGHDPVAAVLLEHGAAVTETTQEGFTPLDLTFNSGNLNVAELLVQKGVSFDAKGKVMVEIMETCEWLSNFFLFYAHIFW